MEIQGVPKFHEPQHMPVLYLGPVSNLQGTTEDAAVRPGPEKPGSSSSRGPGPGLERTRTKWPWQWLAAIAGMSRSCQLKSPSCQLKLKSFGRAAACVIESQCIFLYHSIRSDSHLRSLARLYGIARPGPAATLPEVAGLRQPGSCFLLAE